MKELEILLNKRWILKSEDKDLYYRIRDAVGDLRKYSTESTVAMDFDGYSIGGTALGEPKDVMHKMIEYTVKQFQKLDNNEKSI